MRILSSVSVFVAVILGFLVVYANRFLVRRRKREFGIYLTLGMGRAQVAAIMVMETLAVGVAALVVGLVLGVLLSQVMMYVTANLFEATIPGFAFVFSPGAALSTLACYAAIFALSLLLNVREVSRYRLIDLINTDKVSEKVKARSLPVCVVLFLVSLVLMGVAYRTLLENGVMSDKFGQATALVSVGTALFFFSVSGFLLRFLQGRPGGQFLGVDVHTKKIITCHVGNGGSITAVLNGKSVDTSMGLTPTEGLIMGTRSGDVDPGALTYLMAKHNLSAADMQNIINKDSGIAGVTEISSDMRAIEDADNAGDPRAVLGLQMYEQRIIKYIGAYAAEMGGVDIIVFTGGVGENQTGVRSNVCRPLEFLGVKLDEELNAKIRGKETLISTPDSKVAVCVIPTDEEYMIARDTEAIVEGREIID